MALSAEALIALVALFIACVPGIRFAVQNRELLRQWWRGPALALSAHNPPNEENHENNQLNYTPDSHAIGQPYLPLPSTGSSSLPQLGQSSIFEPFYNALQRLENGIRGQQRESGLFIFTRTFDTGQTVENEPLTGVSTDGASVSHEELHQLL